MCFVDYVKVINLVLAGAEFFEHLDIFTCAPDGVYGDVEGVGLVEEQRELGERELVPCKPFFDRRLRRGGCNCTFRWFRQERRVLSDVFEGPKSR
jgi:hypothetical protein